MSKQAVDVDTDVNEVVLRGRLAAEAEPRELPSGDALVVWRLVVRRDSPARPGVDTVDCVAWRGDVRRSAGSWHPGDTIEINGALRRRFWRSANGTASRYEVEVVRARRLARA